MPVLKKEELEKVRYKSMNDFYYIIDRYDSVADKRKFAVQYLLTYGLAGDPDFPLDEAIHFVRVKLSESVNENTADLNTKVFLANPVKYLNACAKNEYSKFDKNPNLIDDAIISEHYHNLNEQLNHILADQVAALDRNKNAVDVKLRMAISMGGQANLASCVKNTKPGFFSRLFNTSSDEAKNLDRVYKEFNNPDSRGYGNLDNLERVGLAYLRHKFPNLNLQKALPTIDAISRLDKTAKARALLSLQAIEAARAQRKVEAFVGMGNLSTVNDVNVEKLINDDSLFDKEKFMEDLAKQDKATKLEELKEGEEMNLDDEQLVKPANEDSEIYAYDEELHPSKIDIFNNTFEKEVVEANEELGESKYETENIKKAKEEEAELRKHFKDGKFRDELDEYDEFQSMIKEDSEIFINTKDIEEQMERHEYHPRRADVHEERYESPILKQVYKEMEEKGIEVNKDDDSFIDNGL